MFRALAVLRVVLLANAVALNVFRRDNFEHPAWGAVAVLVMAAWTGVVLWAYRVHRRRTALLLVADLAVGVLSILVSPAIKGESMRATIPGFWVAGALFALALRWGWRGGLLAGVALAAADLLVRDQVSQGNYNNIFILIVGGPIVGYLGQSIQRLAVERDRAERAAAVAAERARLARAVHDGVLQVLALMQRRGPELGGDGQELGRLAGEQEAALRSLIRRQDALSAGDGHSRASGAAVVDLTAALEALLAGRTLQADLVSTGGPVRVPETAGRELVAAVGACLDNVARHVGGDARAWVLLEDLPDEVVVTVRDEGPGLDGGRLAAATREGRLGVAESIVGRMRDLGGTAELTTAPGQGVEWELRLPRPSPAE